MPAPRKTGHRSGRPCLRRPITLGGMLAAVALMLAAGLSHAAEHDIRISLQAPSLHAPQLPPSLLVSGEWMDTCLPQVLGSTLDSRHIDILLNAPAGPCAASRKSFQLRVNPALKAGWKTLPAGVYETRVWLERGNGVRDLIAFNMLDAGAAHSAPRPENGFWWSTAPIASLQNLPGSGLNLERQGDHLAVTLLAWDQGEPTWYFGNAGLTGATAQVPLMRMHGGDEPFQIGGNVPVAESGPQLNLEFTGPAHAHAWLSRPRTDSTHAIELQELSLARMPFHPGEPGASLRGRWVLERDDSRVARVFDFSQSSTADADSFRLSEPDSGVTLDCQMSGDASMELATSCSLRENGVPMADFDRVGLERLNGRASLDNAPVQLLRIPR